MEGQKGLDRVRQLADLEESLGFRSSFNFIPEGGYRVSKELRDELTARGFEVGVHDLHHDGKLYWSEEHFKEAATKINRYVQEWGAKGFRSGLMHHNLKWLHYLDVDYDASTFDTDPFEPQPEGVKTVFPFWVEDPVGHRYVELPYTLVQDLNLFCVLKEEGVSIWKQKLNWIASVGGMALLNTHPDYMSFSESPKGFEEFHVGLFSEFLQHVLREFKDACWFVLPRDISAYMRKPEKRNVAIPGG